MYTKLFSHITDSTIWCEDSDTRVVWITLLAMADQGGFVHASVPGLATRAKVSFGAVEAALEKFRSPDKYSMSTEYEGRRIENVEGGWRLLNYVKYRDIKTAEERRAYMREYQRKRRAVNNSVNNVSNVNTSDSDSDSAAKSKSDDSRVREDDVEIYVREIAAIYPKITDPNNLSHEIALAIAEAVARDGRDLVYVGTKGMAEQVAKWPKTELRFIPSAPRYFREAQYKKDPQEWQRSTNGNGKSGEMAEFKRRHKIED